MKVQLWLHIESGGDGSASANFFNTEKEAQASADKELDLYGEALCDNVIPATLIIDEKAKLINVLDINGKIEY